MNDILDTAEVASMLGCTEETVMRKAASGELPGLQFGRAWRFPRVALLDVLNRNALERARLARGINIPPAPPHAVLQADKRAPRRPPALPDGLYQPRSQV